ncbi:hypothetical protein GALMADRAFT_155794 [Galerina marginata CBS 339.88]|uniref:Uncharacterized protein n=1 Tax=Galerina marginata (strain CBS 339.88) TaxID=685588 RepID=A0A067TB71_GALM3|nr:hypothetical protein GALMADRAFT_155794 [Galerina marginata CBS 339.88]
MDSSVGFGPRHVRDGPTSAKQLNYVTMIYLGFLRVTDRIPSIPPFALDHHISLSAGIIPFWLLRASLTWITYNNNFVYRFLNL